MFSLTKQQWLHIDPRFPILYNGSDDVVSIRPDAGMYEEEDSIIILPGYVIQVNTLQGYITRITRDGQITDFLLLETAEEMEDFNPAPLLYALRKELTEVPISNNN